MDWSICPFCDLTVPALQLQRHANGHFDNEEELASDIELAQEISLASSSPPFIMVDNEMPCKPNSLENHQSSSSRCDGMTNNGGGSDTDEKIRYLVSLQIRETVYEVRDGLMTLLKACLEGDSENSTSLLSGYVDHFQSMEAEDVGWGCGWRNIQMLSSHLLKERQEARKALFGGSEIIPDIQSLQRWLEIAWESGFDATGSNDFDNEIYGKRNWIGTTECAALFRSFGLRARIVDFCSKKMTSNASVAGFSHGFLKRKGKGKRNAPQVYGPMDRFLCKGNCNNTQAGHSGHEESKYSDTHLSQVKGHQVLIDWIWNYFSDNQLSKSGSHRVIITEKAPLYFQHHGHSRTIVGIQLKHQKNGMQQYHLLVLDPGHRTKALERSLKENVGWQKLIKRGVHTLKKLQYQLCYIDPGIACGEEMEKLKTLDSVSLEF